MSIFSQRPYSQEIAKTLASGELNPLLARLYAARGVASVDELGLELKYLLPPNTLLHCEDAAKILADAIRDQRQMLIVADYDCDGATACAVGIRGLKMLGASPKQIDFLVPNRFTMGYGLTPEVIDLAKE
ncbi:MAG: single-stranded-DNA-specific exonuclease RecJ, partial [Burkholderiaceae bacterium]|nr:single-stranded-DNA-specific exonuclease RecJ [Burkholderiaceae bacterium]